MAVILFDLGGVIVDASFERLARLLPGQVDAASLRAKWLSSDEVREFEQGRIEPTAFAERFIAHWRLKLAPEDFLERFAEWPSGPFPGAAAVIAELRRNSHVACFSNCNPIHWRRFEPFLGWFDRCFSSHLLGEVKPDVASFEAVLAQLRCEPDEVCFLDDSPANVAAASALGMHAFRTEGIAEVVEVLRRESLLGCSAQS